MFKMIGGDGREYGPVSADEIVAWIREHRANAHTQLQAEGESDWRPAASFSEFAGVLAEAYHESGDAAAALPPPSLDSMSGSEAGPASARAAVREFAIGECLGRGWSLLVGNPILLIGATALVWVIQTGAALVPCIGGVISLVLAGALHAGLMLVFLRRIREEPATVRDVFSQFGPTFLPLMLIWLVTVIVSQIGLIFCLLPGLLFKVMWAFGLTVAVDRGLAFWPALEASRRTVFSGSNFLKVGVLLIVAWLPLIVFEVYSSWRTVQFMADLLGPIEAWRIEALLERRDEFVHYAARLALQEQLVVLLNLPFAYAALMYAYEQLFRTRPRTAGAAD
jgi:hypothetical protein